MPRFTMIESNSGFVWETESGETPAEACKAMDASVGPRDRDYDYVEHGPHYNPNGASGYWVYPATDRDDADGLDGQDPDYVADVESRQCLAFVECVEQTNDWR